jgi:hypothetical protein
MTADVTEHEGPTGAWEADQRRLQAMVDARIDDRFAKLAAAWLPTLSDPAEVLYQVRGTDGIYRTVSVQEMIALNGRGRDMQLLIRWGGVPQ